MSRWLFKLRSLAQVGESLSVLAGLVVDVREQLRTHQIQLDALYSLVKQPPARARHVTVIMLWDGSPGFASTTVVLHGQTSGSLQPMVPVPAGAWLICLGAHLHTVLVGNDLMDVAMPDRSPMCRLIAVPLGVHIRFTVIDSPPS